MPLYRLVSNHPIASSKGFEDYDGKTFEAEPADWEAWCKLAEKRLGFKVDRRPGTSRRIEGVPSFFPARRKVGIHCVQLIPAT